MNNYAQDMKVSYTIKDVDKYLKNSTKTQQEVEQIQQYLYSLPYFQKLFNEIHTSLIPKLIRKFHYGQCQPGCAIIEHGNKIKDFYIILEGVCLEMSKKTQENNDHQNNNLMENLDKTPFLKILKQCEERKKSLLFQQTPTQPKNHTSKFKEENKQFIFQGDQIDQNEQVQPHQKQMSQLNLRPVMEDLFIQQYRKKYEKKGFSIQNTLKEGDYFGGIVKKGAEQTFSDIVCCTNVEYVCLPFDQYWEILSQYQLRMQEEKITFLRSYRFLSIYSDHYLNKRLNMFEDVTLYRNQQLFEEAQKSLYIYFIIEGELVMHKNVDFKQHLDNLHQDSEYPNISNKPRSKSMHESQEGTTEIQEFNDEVIVPQNIGISYGHLKKNIIISYLNPGSYIGLSEILTDSLYTYTVTCFSTEAKVYRLQKANFEKFFQCETNIEIMAEDCLGKEKIYDDILEKNSNIMKKEYDYIGKQNKNSSLLQIFKKNKKRNGSSSNLIIPGSTTSQNQPRNDKSIKQPSVIEQRIMDKLNSLKIKVSKEDLQKEKTNELQNTILKSINKDAVYRRRLLNNLSNLGFKVNKDNCYIYNELKAKTSTALCRQSSLQHEQESIKSPIPQNAESQRTKVISQNQQNQQNQNQETMISQSNQQTSRSTQRKSAALNSHIQQELSRKRLSFVIIQQDQNKRRLSIPNKIKLSDTEQKPKLQQNLSNNYQISHNNVYASPIVQISHNIEYSQSNLKLNDIYNTPSIEDLKCFENNITYRKRQDNQSQCSSPNERNLNSDQQIDHNVVSQFNSKSSIVFNNECEFLTAAQVVVNNQDKLSKQRKSSISPQSPCMIPSQPIFVNKNTNEITQNCELKSTVSPFNIVKNISKRNIDEEVVQNEQQNQNQMKSSPLKVSLESQEENDQLQDIQLQSHFLTYRQQLVNNLNKGLIQTKIESPVKQTASQVKMGMNVFHNPHLNNYLQLQSLNDFATSPTVRKKKTNKSSNSLQTINNMLEYPKTVTILSQCSHQQTQSNANTNTNSNSNRLVSDYSMNSPKTHKSMAPRQQVMNIQYNVTGIHENKQSKEFNLATIASPNKNRALNIHSRNKSQNNFREKLYQLVDKHIQENIGNKKSYIQNKPDQFQVNSKYSNNYSNINNINNNDINNNNNNNYNNNNNNNNNQNQTERRQKSQGDQLQVIKTGQNNQSTQFKSEIIGIKCKKASCITFQSSPSYTLLTDNQDSNQILYTLLQSPIQSKQSSRLLLKRCSIPIFSPTSTKITQLSTAHSPSFSSFQTAMYKNHSRMPSDQSCSNITQNFAKNHII